MDQYLKLRLERIKGKVNIDPKIIRVAHFRHSYTRAKVIFILTRILLDADFTSDECSEIISDLRFQISKNTTNTSISETEYFYIVELLKLSNLQNGTIFTFKIKRKKR